MEGQVGKGQVLISSGTEVVIVSFGLLEVGCPVTSTILLGFLFTSGFGWDTGLSSGLVAVAGLSAL